MSCKGGFAFGLFEFSILTGLAKPLLEEGDIGKARIVLVGGGDLESMSDALRSCGVAPVYMSRAVAGEPSRGRCGDRDGGAMIGEGLQYLYQQLSALIFVKITYNEFRGVFISGLCW